MTTETNKITLFKLFVYYGTIIGVAILVISLMLISPPRSDPKIVGYTPEQALLLIHTHTNLIILDLRSNQSDYNESHITNAIWINGTLSNRTSDILVYNQNGYYSNICDALSEVNEGKIYYMMGGFNAWIKEDYPIKEK